MRDRSRLSLAERVANLLCKLECAPVEEELTFLVIRHDCRLARQDRID
jgi:hypothetical protein